jgi:hypothetical protein
MPSDLPVHGKSPSHPSPTRYLPSSAGRIRTAGRVGSRLRQVTGTRAAGSWTMSRMADAGIPQAASEPLSCQNTVSWRRAACRSLPGCAATIATAAASVHPASSESPKARSAGSGGFCRKQTEPAVRATAQPI